jgi:hypothetical protein
MYLLYIDHSGEPANPSERYFVMAGVAVFERQIYHLKERLDEVQRNHLPEESGQVEFHVSAIRKHDRPPWKGMLQGQWDEVLRAVYDVIANAHPSVCLFGQAVEKSQIVPDFGEKMAEALRKKREAQENVKNARGKEKAAAKQSLREAEEECRTLTGAIVARGFEGLCTQFEYFLRRFYEPDNPDQQQRGLMIFDRASYEKELQLLMDEFRSYGTRVAQVFNIAEVPLFTDSDATRMLQVADFVSFAIFRRYESRDSSYFDRVAHRFDQHDGVVHGLAHISSGASTCMCPACVTRRLRKGNP